MLVTVLKGSEWYDQYIDMQEIKKIRYGKLHNNLIHEKEG